MNSIRATLSLQNSGPDLAHLAKEAKAGKPFIVDHFKSLGGGKYMVAVHGVGETYFGEYAEIYAYVYDNGRRVGDLVVVSKGSNPVVYHRGKEYKDYFASWCKAHKGNSEVAKYFAKLPMMGPDLAKKYPRSS